MLHMHVIPALTDRSSQLGSGLSKFGKYYASKKFKSERQQLGRRQKENQSRGIYLVLKEILQDDYDSLQSFENLRPESGLTWKDD
jgi:hypothetical protein